MNLNQKRREVALCKELLAVEKQEKKMEQAALKAKPATWKKELESRIPEKVYAGLESAFCKGFGVVFDQGRAIIEKGYNKEDMQAGHTEDTVYAVFLHSREHHFACQVQSIPLSAH